MRSYLKRFQFLAVCLAFLGGCSSTTRQLAGNVTATTLPTGNTACATALSAQITLMNINALLQVNQPILWSVAAQGCTGNYKLVRAGQADISFSSSSNFTTSFTTSGPQSVTGTVVSLDSTGAILSRYVVTSATVTVNPAPVVTTAQCPTIAASPVSQSSTYSTTNSSVLVAVPFSFTVTLKPNTILTAINSSSTTAPTGPALPYSSTAAANFGVSLNAPNSNTVVFVIANSFDSTNVVNCSSIVTIDPPAAVAVITPPAPVPVNMVLTAVTSDGTFVSTVSGAHTSLTSATAKSGSTVALSWTTSGVGSCTLGASSGASGSLTSPALTAATSYSLLCYGTSDQLLYSAQISVAIDAPPPPDCAGTGVKYNGVCYYPGTGSCTNVCATHGGSNSQLLGYAECQTLTNQWFSGVGNYWQYTSTSNSLPAACYLSHGGRGSYFVMVATGSLNSDSYDPALSATGNVLWHLVCGCNN